MELYCHRGWMLTFLESPYAHFINQQAKIENDIPLFFWLSVVWRMSVTEDYGFSLGDELNQILQLSLKSYFELKEVSIQPLFWRFEQ